MIEPDIPRAFSLRLDRQAPQYYFHSIRGKQETFEGVVTQLHERFVTQERALTLTREWDCTSLLGYMKENPEKLRNETSELMVARLKELHVCLSDPNRTEIIMKNKLLTACDGVDERPLPWKA